MQQITKYNYEDLTFKLIVDITEGTEDIDWEHLREIIPEKLIERKDDFRAITNFIENKFQDIPVWNWKWGRKYILWNTKGKTKRLKLYNMFLDIVNKLTTGYTVDGYINLKGTAFELIPILTGLIEETVIEEQKHKKS